MMMTEMEVMLTNTQEKGGVAMRKELEYAKKMTLIAKLYRMELLSENEYEKIRRKMMDSYLIAEVNAAMIREGNRMMIKKKAGKTRMETKVIQSSLIFKGLDRMTVQRNTATDIQKWKWQVKEMEEDYEHERSTGLTGN